MTRSAKEMEALLIAGMKEALAISSGELKPTRARTRTLTAKEATVAPPPEYDARRVVKVRSALAVSQPVFAKVLNVSTALVRGWERGSRVPNGAAARLLQVAENSGQYLVKGMVASASNQARSATPAGRPRSRVPEGERAGTLIFAKRVKSRGRKRSA